MTDSLAEPGALADEGALRLFQRIRRKLRAERARRSLARGLEAHRRRRYRAAFRNFSAAARAGDPEAQYRIGLLYSTGEGVISNPPEAALWYRRAAERGHLQAQFQLSLAYLHGQLGAADKWYQAAAAHDRLSAEWNRAMWFPSGISLERDYAAALRSSLLAAEQGLSEAQANVGSLYLRGLGCECNYDEARRWYELAAAQGNGEAAYGLGMIHANGLGIGIDLAAAARWYAIGAERENDAAQMALGLMYAAGQGVPRDPSRAAALFRQAADAGNPRARHNLGLSYLRGEGLPQDKAAAEAAFREAARAGYAPAMLSLAQLCERDQNSAAGPTEAVLWYKGAAAAGSSEAQFILGRLYARGDGVPLMLNEAARWFESAAEQGHATAQFNIAALYMQGSGVERDPGKAMEWYRRAAAQGLAAAEVRLAHLQLVGEEAAGDRQTALGSLKQAADRGDSEAETALALYYLEAGSAGDRSAAQRLLRRAAERGHAPACAELCRLLAAGQLLEASPLEAVQWQQTAAAAGHVAAQLLLARNLLHGTGGEKDPAAAASWLQKAADQGDADAQFELAALHYLGNGVSRDWEAALKWYRRAAEQGNRYAQHNLAEMLRKGEGREANLGEAVEWYMKAAEQRLAESQCALGDLALHGEGMPPDREPARLWYERAAAEGSAEASAKLAELLRYGETPIEVPPLQADFAGDAAHGVPAADSEMHAGVIPDGEPVRLVIWDLDETFWDGTLSEGGIRAYLQQNHDIVVTLAERGIISSICSKNDSEAVHRILEEHGIWDHFVFPSIDWTAKGQRIAAIIEAVQLRPSNVLFIDDNPMNRAEAAALVPGIQIADVTLLPQLLADPRFKGKDDRELTRLRQYRLLQERHQAQIASGSDPEEFLRASNIRVFIDIDVAANIDRAIELINRTNQLNFTKRRLPENLDQARVELLSAIEPFYVQTGLIRVIDNYGDYGYCGFYLSSGPSLVHYCFSCRILGMGVETWLYQRLGRPKITVTGEVLTDLAAPREIDWISLAAKRQDVSQPQAVCIPEVRLRGGCDLAALAHYFHLVAPTIHCETNHHRSPLFVHMDSSLQLLPSIAEMPPEFFAATERLGYARDDFTSRFLEPAPPGSVLVYSAWADVYVSVYRHRKHGFAIPVSVDIYHDLTAITDEDLAQTLAELQADAGRREKISEIVATLRAEYEHQPWLYSASAVDIMRRIFERIPEGARLFVILPHEWGKWTGELTPRTLAIEYNAAVRELARDYPAVTLIAMNDVVRGSGEMQDAFDHFDRIVYFRTYQRIIEDLEAEKQSPGPNAAAEPVACPTDPAPIEAEAQVT